MTADPGDSTGQDGDAPKTSVPEPNEEFLCVWPNSGTTFRFRAIALDKPEKLSPITWPEPDERGWFFLKVKQLDPPPTLYYERRTVYIHYVDDGRYEMKPKLLFDKTEERP